MADTASVTVNGTLKTTGGTPLSGMSISTTDSLGNTLPAATTDVNGNFSSSATVAAPTANYTATCKFAGNASYQAASVTTAPTNLIVGTTLTATVTATVN